MVGKACQPVIPRRRGRIAWGRGMAWAKVTAATAVAVVTGLAVLGSMAWVACAPHKIGTGKPFAVEAEKQIWSFGTIERGERATTRLRIRNTGRATVRLSLLPSCDCLAADVEPAVVPPSGSAWLSLSFLGDEVKEATSKTLYVDFGEPSENAGPGPTRLTITVTGTVVEGHGPHIVVTPNPLPVVTRPDRDRKAAGEPSASAAGGADGRERAGEGKAGETAQAGADVAGAAAIRVGTLTISNRGKEDLVVKAVRGFGCAGDWSEVVLEPGGGAELVVETTVNCAEGRWIEIESNDPITPLKKISLVEMD